MLSSQKVRVSRGCFSFLLFSGLLVTRQAHAYLDPGNGSFFIQILIATLIGLPLTFTEWFRKLKAFLKSRFKKPPK